MARAALEEAGAGGARVAASAGGTLIVPESGLPARRYRWTRTDMDPDPAGEWCRWSVDVELGDALLNWYDTTHGNEFGHDHHCPVRHFNAYQSAPGVPAEPDDRCTCGWSGVLRAEVARVDAEKEEGPDA